MTTSTDTTNPSTITRRTALTASLAAVPLLAAPALTDDADTELLALEREWLEAMAALRRTHPVLDAAEAAEDAEAIAAAEDLQTEAYHAMTAVEHRICDATAHSLRGAAVKARVIENMRGCLVGDEAHDLAHAVLALAGVPAHDAA